MKMMTKAIEAKIPPLYTNENVADPTVVAKFFDPTGGATWYVLEGEKQPDGDWLFFGFVSGLVPGGDELGYFTLNELVNAKKGLTDFRRFLPIERDLYFDPKPLSVAKATRA